MLKISELTCEYEKNPLAVASARPRFGWAIESGSVDVAQASYRLQVALDESFASPLLDTGDVASGISQFVRYSGKSLKPRTRYHARVRITDTDGDRSDWSAVCRFETSFLNEKWTAPFIATPLSLKLPKGGASYLRSEFVIGTDIESARAYVTALGLYELWINGTRVGDALLTPGWTSYSKRLAYQTYDIGSLLKPGKNAIGAVLGEGWYAGDLTWLKRRNFYGPRTALSASVRIRSAQGRERIINTDETWQSGGGPVLYSQIYHGETFDARLDDAAWCRTGFRASGWANAEAVAADASVVVPQDGPPVLRQEILPVREVIVTPKGEKVLDFGQLMSGWVAFKARGRAGDKVVLKHAEVLDADGNFYTANMRGAKNLIDYTLRGGAEESFEPHFTFQGFRYVMVEQYPGEVKGEDFSGVVLHSQMEKTLDFTCSNEMLNKLQHNIEWGWKGNAVDIPTDCPQRDERLGWTGDAQVFIGTAAYLYGVAPFFRKWLRDLKADQIADGGVPFVIPDILTPIAHLEEKLKESHSSTGWGDAAVVCPWMAYARYGDAEILAEQYASMKAWVEYIRRRARDGKIWDNGFHFGDWVALDAKEGSYFGATPNDLTATAYYAYSTRLLALSAEVLGKKKEAAAYRKLHREIVAAFRSEFFTPSGRLAARTQTSYILALVLGLVSDKNRSRTVADFVSLLDESGGHMTTGFLGTPWICRALGENGRIDYAYSLLLKEDYPSWLYQVTRGATTVWEHLDGLKPDGTMWSPDMNSFNHYAYGAVGEWMYKNIGGLSVDETGLTGEAGFKSVTFRPQPGGGITSSRIAYRSAYGTHAIDWKLDDGKFFATIDVPPNTTATVILPGKARDVTGSPRIAFSDGTDGATANIGSGTYRMECRI